MSLSEIKKWFEDNKLLYSYGSFKKKVQPPHIIGRILNTDNFSADNIVYFKNCNFILELTTLDKNLILQKKIEDDLLKNIYWNKIESYLSEEEVYNTSYYFIVEEK